MMLMLFLQRVESRYISSITFLYYRLSNLNCYILEMISLNIISVFLHS